MNTTLTTLLIAGTAAIATADTLYLQDFENGDTGYSTSTPEFSNSSGTDFFGRSDNISFSRSVNYTGADGNFFAGMDLDGGVADVPLSLTTSEIDISNTNNLQFAIDLAEDDDGSSQDWDALDYVRFEYEIDGNGWVEIFTVENDGSTYNTAPRVNGTIITDTFSTFSADLSGLTGIEMVIRAVWSLDSGDEDLAIDNILLTGDRIAVVPLPSAAFAGLGLLGAMGAYRRIRA